MIASICDYNRSGVSDAAFRTAHELAGLLVTFAMASIPIPSGRSLRPVQNRGEADFDQQVGRRSHHNTEVMP